MFVTQIAELFPVFAEKLIICDLVSMAYPAMAVSIRALRVGKASASV